MNTAGLSVGRVHSSSRETAKGETMGNLKKDHVLGAGSAALAAGGGPARGWENVSERPALGHP